MTRENKNEFYVEICWISREGTAGNITHLQQTMYSPSLSLFPKIFLDMSRTRNNIRIWEKSTNPGLLGGTKSVFCMNLTILIVMLLNA